MVWRAINAFNGHSIHLWKSFHKKIVIRVSFSLYFCLISACCIWRPGWLSGLPGLSSGPGLPVNIFMINYSRFVFVFVAGAGAVAAQNPDESSLCAVHNICGHTIPTSAVYVWRIINTYLLMWRPSLVLSDAGLLTKTSNGCESLRKINHYYYSTFVIILVVLGHYNNYMLEYFSSKSLQVLIPCYSAISSSFFT